MGQILHKRATTTYAVRAELQRSTDTIQTLSQRYHLNPKTVLKWKHRSDVCDAPMGSKRVRTVLSEKEEAVICAFRHKTSLPLDDCYVALKETIPSLSRSNLHRCLKRHGLSRLPKDPSSQEKKRFKAYDIGYFHIDICEVATSEGKAYLYVAIDRTSKFVYAQVYPSPTSQSAALFLKDLALAVPYKIHTVLTDNGIQFSYALLKKKPKEKKHDFQKVCERYHIRHRLTQVRHPWTNGQVERMNRTLKEATVKTYHYETMTLLKRHLNDFITAYNYAKKLKTLRFLTPIEKILHEYKNKPNLFHTNPYHYSTGLNT